MAKAAKEMSVAELERILNSRKSLLDGLIRKRDRLAKELSGVEKKINTLGGDKGATTGSVRGHRVVKRPKNDKSLHTVVQEILAKSKKGIALDPLSKKVMEAGYKTNSSNFKNVLYQCLYNSEFIVHDPETSVYKLK